MPAELAFTAPYCFPGDPTQLLSAFPSNIGAVYCPCKLGEHFNEGNYIIAENTDKWFRHQNALTNILISRKRGRSSERGPHRRQDNSKSRANLERSVRMRRTLGLECHGFAGHGET